MNSPHRWGDVITLDFPYSNLAGSKFRPAVVISGPKALAPYDDVLLLAISTQLNGLPEHCHLDQWKAAGLAQPSSFKPNILTLERRLIAKQIGSLSESDRVKLKQLIIQMTKE